MNFFKRLFGQKPKPAAPDKDNAGWKDTSNNSEVAPEKIATIKASMQGPLYPILKPGSWVALEHAVWNPLIGSREEPKVVIAYGYDAGEQFTFLTKMKAGERDYSEIHKEAIGNLGSYPHKLSISDISGGQVVTASGTDFSAEKFMDTSFMKAVSEKLGTKSLWISIPRRSCIMIGPSESIEEYQHAFIRLHLHAWQDASYGNAPIVNGIFVTKDGAFEGFIDLEQNN